MGRRREEGLGTIKGEWYKVAGKVARCAAASLL